MIPAGETRPRLQKSARTWVQRIPVVIWWPNPDATPSLWLGYHSDGCFTDLSTAVINALRLGRPRSNRQRLAFGS